jgi:hypothetical protein
MPVGEGVIYDLRVALFAGLSVCHCALHQHKVGELMAA